MILVYPNCYGLPVIKQTDYEEYTRSEDLEENEENNGDIFSQYDDEYINETIKKRHNAM